MQAAHKAQWEGLSPLNPFFRDYSESFVENFLNHYKTFFQIDAGRSGRAAVTHLYIRHFIPGLAKKIIPEMSPSVSKLYGDMLRAKHIISLTLVQMMKDLVAFQQMLNAKQLELFQTYLVENLPDAAPDEAQVRETVEDAGGSARGVIMDILSKIQEEDAPLHCFNLYKDVPISDDSQVVRVFPKQGRAAVKISENQAAASRLEGHTYLKCPLLPGTVKAELISLDREKNVAVIGKFHLSNLREQNRQTVRVQPMLPLETVVTCAVGEVTGEVTDISLTGLGLRLPKSSLKLAEEVKLKITLPATDGGILATGKIVAFRHEGKKSVAGVRLMLGDREEEAVQQYILERQGEVVRELRRFQE